MLLDMALLSLLLVSAAGVRTSFGIINRELSGNNSLHYHRFLRRGDPSIYHTFIACLIAAWP
jgi:hypothetical protein